MIMENKILFGYNDILITNRLTNKLIIKFEELHFRKEKNSGDIIKLVTFEYKEDVSIFIETLKTVSKENPVCRFRDYTFDFTNFNQKSLDNVIEAFTTLVSLHQRLLAM